MNENMDKVYHIYAKGQCIYHSLTSEQFTETWDMMHKLLSICGTSISPEELSYEELDVPEKELISNTSH